MACYKQKNKKKLLFISKCGPKVNMFDLEKIFICAVFCEIYILKRTLLFLYIIIHYIFMYQWAFGINVSWLA
ncbi:hypothetical protein ACJX0J_030795, partial [Zea mays]